MTAASAPPGRRSAHARGHAPRLPLASELGGRCAAFAPPPHGANRRGRGVRADAGAALLSEGLDLPGEPRGGVALGVLVGVVFILLSRRWLHALLKAAPHLRPWTI